MFRAPLCPPSGAQSRTLLLKTKCSSVRPYTPEDGHNGARNMLSYWFINKSQMLHQVGLKNQFIYKFVASFVWIFVDNSMPFLNLQTLPIANTT